MEFESFLYESPNGSNPNNRKLRDVDFPDFVKACLDANHASSLRAFVKDVRTFVSRDTPETIEMISGIKKLLEETAESSRKKVA